jgi:hypothetical protein
MPKNLKISAPVIPAFIWAFVAIELAFHLNISLHWAAIDWRVLDVLNNRPAYAICLTACLAFCYAETNDWGMKFFLWIPFGSLLLFIFLPSERQWALAIESVYYPDRTEYASGQAIYTALIYFPIALTTHYWFEKKRIIKDETSDS